MNLEQNSFITNHDKFLSEIINGILPKCNSIDILVGYFYYSGFDLICEAIKDKYLRILVGLDVDVKVSTKVCKIDQFVKLNQSRGKVRDNYYEI